MKIVFEVIVIIITILGAAFTAYNKLEEKFTKNKDFNLFKENILAIAETNKEGINKLNSWTNGVDEIITTAVANESHVLREIIRKTKSSVISHSNSELSKYRSQVTSQFSSLEESLNELSSKEYSVKFDQWEGRDHSKTYLAETNGFVIARIDTHGTITQGTICGLSDTSNNPTIKRASASVEYSTNKVYIPHSSFTMPVRKGDYWKVELCQGDKEGIHVYWLPTLLITKH